MTLTGALPSRVIAVDWSGARIGAEKRIWRADVVDGDLVELRNGYTGREVAGQLIAAAEVETGFVVGLDFAFSMPAWFLAREGIGFAQALWARAAAGECEGWLRECARPFWGRKGSTMPRDCELYRGTEREVEASTGFRPKSVFQIGGAGAVGTASLRGMPVLHVLHEAGFHVWPYDDPGWPLVLEIYPRVLTGRVRKSYASARRAFVADRYTSASPEHRASMVASEDAFDAGVSALEMWRRRQDFASLPRVDHAQARLEGLVWYPEMRPAGV